MRDKAVVCLSDKMVQGFGCHSNTQQGKYTDSTAEDSPSVTRLFIINHPKRPREHLAPL